MAASRITCRNTIGTARLQAGLLFVATIAMLVPSVIADSDRATLMEAFAQTLSLGLSVLLIVIYALGLAFSLGTHREFFAAPITPKPAKCLGR